MQWICSRCSKAFPENRLLGRRFRFAGEKCPTCENPGVGMVLLVPEETKDAREARKRG